MQVSEFDVNRWNSSQHSIVIEGPQFRVAGEVDKRSGAIDLVMQIKNCRFPDALVWLERQFGRGTARAAAIEQVNITAAEVEAARFKPPVQSAGQWPAVRAELLKQTYLPSRLLDELHEEGLVYANAEGDAVFIERDIKGDIGGAIKRGANGEFKRIENSDAAAAFYVIYPDNQVMQRPDRIVITDTPIEALAKLTIERTAPPTQRNQYQSLGGHSAVLEQSEGIRQVSVALSRQAGTDSVAEAIYQVIPWATNEQPTVSHQGQLKAEIDELRSKLKPLSDINKSQTRQQLRRKGKSKDQGMGM